MDKTRRGEERVCVALPVSLCGGTGLTRDVSATGLYVQTGAAPVLGESVSFSLALDNPGGRLVLRGRGDVVRIEGHGAKAGVAVRITYLTLESDPSGPARAVTGELT